MSITKSALILLWNTLNKNNQDISLNENGLMQSDDELEESIERKSSSPEISSRAGKLNLASSQNTEHVEIIEHLNKIENSINKLDGRVKDIEKKITPILQYLPYIKYIAGTIHRRVDKDSIRKQLHKFLAIYNQIPNTECTYDPNKEKPIAYDASESFGSALPPRHSELTRYDLFPDDLENWKNFDGIQKFENYLDFE